MTDDVFVAHTFHRTPSGRYWHWTEHCPRVPDWHWRYAGCTQRTVAPSVIKYPARCPHCWPRQEREA